MDVLAEHAIAGVVGLLFNAFFAADYIIGLDGVNTGLVTGGWLNHNYKQLYIQVAYIVACCAYTFVVSAIIAFAIDKIPGLKLRASEEAELLGMDDDQLGEFAYDYVEVRRDYLAWTPAKDMPDSIETHVNPEDRHGIAEHVQMIHGESPASSSHEQHAPAQGGLEQVAAEAEKKMVLNNNNEKQQ
jgi:Amt family ammonium transporter